MKRYFLILLAVSFLQLGSGSKAAANGYSCSACPGYSSGGCYVYYYYYYRGPRSKGPTNAFYPFDANYLRSLRHNPGSHYYRYRSPRPSPFGPAGGGASAYYVRPVRVR